MNTDTDDFRIKDLAKDKDALLLIGLSVLLALLIIIGLAVLSDEQWNRIIQRGNILWAAGLAALPMLLAIWQRYQLRRDSALALGNASQPTVHTEQTVNTPGDVIVPRGVTGNGNGDQSNPPAEPADLTSAALPDSSLDDDEEEIDYSGDAK